MALVNGDDACLKTLKEEHPPYVLKTFGINKHSDIYVTSWSENEDGLKMAVLFKRSAGRLYL